jgi:hypothetical protein
MSANSAIEKLQKITKEKKHKIVNINGDRRKWKC